MQQLRIFVSQLIVFGLKRHVAQPGWVFSGSLLQLVECVLKGMNRRLELLDIAKVRRRARRSLPSTGNAHLLNVSLSLATVASLSKSISAFRGRQALTILRDGRIKIMLVIVGIGCRCHAAVSKEGARIVAIIVKLII